MAKKTVTGHIVEHYVVKAQSEEFQYTLDFAERAPEGNSQGTSPTGMLLTALAGCHLMTARSYLEGRNILFKELNVKIDGNFINGKTNWSLDADVLLRTDAPLDTKQVNSMEKFIRRHCTVSSVLQAGNQINCHIELV